MRGDLVHKGILMSTDAIAGCTLGGYVLLLAGLVLWRAWRCPQGWRLWVLYLIDTLYCRLGFHWRADRRCPFIDEAPALIIANHRSPLDPMLIWVGVTNRRPLEFLTAREYFGIPGLQFIFDNLRAIPVARDGQDVAATRAAIRRLREGRLLGVFPEGGINPGPGLRVPNSSGAAWLALHSRAPVYPVFILNAPQSESMVKPFVMFTRVHVKYGERIDLSAYYGRRTSPELLQEVTDLLLARLAALGGIEPPSAPAAEPAGAPATIGMSNAG
jgi:1-acyl-sn-glycerol-3-phosphate acyltransferase